MQALKARHELPAQREQRRDAGQAGRQVDQPTGWLPWGGLAAGTADSLVANIATAYPDPVSRVIAGWLAPALLFAVKLLSGMLEAPRLPA